MSRDPLTSAQWQRRVLWGLAWGVGWATVLNLASSSSVLYRMESDAQEQLLRWRGPEQASSQVVIIGIDGRTEGNPQGQSADFLLERTNYAALALRLLKDAEAKVAVLNLPSSFVVPQTLVSGEDLDAPLRQIVQEYQDNLVLATRSSESFRQAEISIYNHFLPFSSLKLEYLVPPDYVQGVVQYQVDEAGVLRKAQLRGKFIRRDSRALQGFAMVEALTLFKFDAARAKQLVRSGQMELQFDPLGPSGQVPIIPIEQVCASRTGNPCLGSVDPQILEKLRGKVVLVGFLGGYPETFPLRTAYGTQIAAVELQAQILSSMLTNRVYHTIPNFLAGMVILLAGIGTGGALMMSKRRLGGYWPKLRMQGRLLWPLMGLAVYEGWAVLQFLLGRWVWPVVLPLWASGR